VEGGHPVVAVGCGVVVWVGVGGGHSVVLVGVVGGHPTVLLVGVVGGHPTVLVVVGMVVVVGPVDGGSVVVVGLVVVVVGPVDGGSVVVGAVVSSAMTVTVTVADWQAARLEGSIPPQ